MTPFVGDSSKYRALLEKIAERKRVISENPNYFEGGLEIGLLVKTALCMRMSGLVEIM